MNEKIFSIIFALLAIAGVCFLLVATGCVQVYQYGSQASVTVSTSIMNTATVPVQVGPGGLPIP